MKKILVNEEERKRILNLHTEATKKEFLIEQTEELNIKKAVQCFLNKVVPNTNLKVDGSHGDETEKVIKKYQVMRKVYPTDGVWGPDTMDSMTSSDRKVMDECVSEYNTLFDKIFKWFGL
jgi:peptidoglycan hydrolase-like protein with peptidoglycan-binding domain